MMKQILFAACIAAAGFSCFAKGGRDKNVRGNLSAPYKATYSSNITAPSHPEYGQMVLTVWKLYENKQTDEMKKYYADTVTYDAFGHRFYGRSGDLLAYARKDVENLDSLRFDISMWESVHINDKNEDWVYVWATERRYNKGGKADTSLMHEQWQIKNNKVVYFNMYNAEAIKLH